MSTISKQWLQHKISDMEEHRNLFPGDLDDDHGSVLAALRIALASLEAEAVAYIIQDADARSRGEKGILRYFANISDEDINEYQITVTPLYTAPTAPVSVPDERYQHLSELYHAQEKRLFKLAQRIKGPAFDKYAHSPSQAIDVLESALFGENDEDCRAAMLQGADGNSPVIANGWVACSERMPPEYEPVYIFHPDYGVSQDVWYDHQEDAFVWDDETRFRELESVSHWMAMPAPPAAPQQEDK